MARSKRRRTITLDPAIAEVLDDDDEALSAAVNEVLENEVERRQRGSALARLLRILTAERGPVETADVEDFHRLGAVGTLVLDSEAVSALAWGGDPERTVRAALTAAATPDRAGSSQATQVVVPAAALVELYRGGAQDQAVDACLGAEGGIAVIATDRALARRIGKILADAGRTTEDHADASVVAVCAAAGGGVILTGDPRRVTDLCGTSPAIVVRGIGAKWRPAVFGTQVFGMSEFGTGTSEFGPAVSRPPTSGRPMSGPPMSGPPLSGPPLSGSSRSGPSRSGPSLSGPSRSGSAVGP